MIDPRRRSFLRGRIAEAAASHAARAQRPPWAVAEAAFISQCVRCHACVQACPRHVIAVGDGGFPVMDFSQKGCNLCDGEDFFACEAACEPLALHRAAHASPAQPWPGWGIAVSERCLVQRQIECRSCGDACDTRVIRFRPALGGIAQMQLDLSACTACGECVSVCPAEAMRVVPVDKRQEHA